MGLSQDEALKRLGTVLVPLNFCCTNRNAKMVNERKMVLVFAREYIGIIWTTVTGFGTAPKNTDCLRFLLVHKGPLWKFKDLRRYNSNFYTILERRAKVLSSLGKSRLLCPTHRGKMVLWIDNQDHLYWVCNNKECDWRTKVEMELAKKVRFESSVQQWQLHKQI